MIITYYGVSCFKMQSGGLVLVIDPPSKRSGLKAPRFGADIVLISHDHDRHNGFEVIQPREQKEPFLISGPGEYEIKEVVIQGIRSFHDAVSGRARGLNTVYLINLENLNICHLGDFGEKELRPELLSALGGKIDLLFSPVTFPFVNQLSPKIVIPMHYKNKSQLGEFLKSIGQENKSQPLDRFSFRAKDIFDKNSEAVVLNASI
jgi:L-ascorbate metabolism protein UlaG (beta-lactamase superfamily)